MNVVAAAIVFAILGALWFGLLWFLVVEPIARWRRYR